MNYKMNYKKIKVHQPKEYNYTIAQLKAYKKGQAEILLQRIIKNVTNDLAEFQKLRITIIETFKNDFDKFETNLIREI